MNEKERTDIVFEITEHIGVITTYGNGWTKEINMVAWNDAKPKYDIRDWNPDHQVMSRGITLHSKEMREICKLLRGRPDLADDDPRQAAPAGSAGPLRTDAPVHTAVPEQAAAAAF